MSQHDAIGQDSFLDIVANLVGILIILVVIIGAQAATVWQQPKSAFDVQQNQLADLSTEAEKRRTESRSMELENAELNRKLDYERAISNRLNENRMNLLVAIENNRRLLDLTKSELDVNQRTHVETSAKIDSLKQQIRQVRYEFSATENLAKPLVKVIEHYPTPIARTVFSDEVHFLIEGNRISHVPLEELVAAMKNEWKVKAKKLAQAKDTWESVGPIGEYRLQYKLRTVTLPGRQPSQYGIEFDRFVVQPVNGKRGEELNFAMNSGSKFHATMKRFVPGKTTVSIWVYPDGYDQLIEVRTWLRKRGFLTASWPLEFSQPISGGPNGLRTSTN